MSDSTKQRIVVGITGASGAIYALRTVRAMVRAGVEVHLVVSPLGQRLLHDELGMEGINLAQLGGGAEGRRSGAEAPGASPGASPGVSPGMTPATAPGWYSGGGESGGGVKLHHYRDVGATIASGSFVHDGMVIVPCSSNTLSAVATGASQNLLHRAAYVTLKERRRLVLVHRETPITLADIRNMEAVTLMGGMVMPASPGFYMLPRSIEELADQLVARVLDLMGVGHDLRVRWGEPAAAVDTLKPGPGRGED